MACGRYGWKVDIRDEASLPLTRLKHPGEYRQSCCHEAESERCHKCHCRPIFAGISLGAPGGGLSLRLAKDVPPRGARAKKRKYTDHGKYVAKFLHYT